MNLETFAAQVIKINIPKQPNPKDALRILPPQQKNRSYKDLEKTTVKFDPEMLKYHIGEYQGEWVLRYNTQLHMGIDRKEITKKQIDNFVQDFLKTRSNLGDEKYLKVIRANINQIWYQFDIIKWFNDNFKSAKPKFKPPMSLVFKVKTDLPSFVFINAVKNELDDFIEARFESWMKLNSRKLFHKSFDFLRKITPKFFDYKFDSQAATMRAGLKYTVVIGALALYSMYKHDKEFSKKEVSQIKSRVGRLGDIGKLDRYIKKF